MRRVGHKGAGLIAPGNTRASFEAALAAGVDMIEFDVLPFHGELVLAHDYTELDRQGALKLGEALELLSGEAFDGLDYDVDLKLPGYELAVVEALREHGLLERSLITSQYRESLALIRALEPGVRLGWSVPKLRRDPFRFRALWVPASVVLLALRELVPLYAAHAIRSGQCEALMAHWRLVTPRLVRAVARAGGELYVWTVDELPRIRTLHALGVSGVISNDPRLFEALAAS